MSFISTDEITMAGGFFASFGDDGTNRRSLGRMRELEFSGEVETVEVKDSLSGQLAVVKTFIVSRAPTFSGQMLQMGARQLQMAMSGGVLTSVSAGGVNIGKEIVQLSGTTPAGLPLPLAETANMVVTSVDGQTTYTVETDYTFSRANQNIVRVGSGSIADGALVVVSYDWDAPAHTSFTPFTRDIVRGPFLFRAFPSSGARIVWDVPSAELVPAETIGLSDEEPVRLPFTVKILDASDSYPNAPFGTIRHWVPTS